MKTLAQIYEKDLIDENNAEKKNKELDRYISINI